MCVAGLVGRFAAKLKAKLPVLRAGTQGGNSQMNFKLPHNTGGLIIWGACIMQI